jgi:hypothetical protein
VVNRVEIEVLEVLEPDVLRQLQQATWACEERYRRCCALLPVTAMLLSSIYPSRDGKHNLRWPKASSLITAHCSLLFSCR